MIEIEYMYTGVALSFGLIRACRSGLVLYCSVLSDAGGENDGSSSIFEISLFDGILPKGPYPPCLRMADRALLAGPTCHAYALRIGPFWKDTLDISPDHVAITESWSLLVQEMACHFHPFSTEPLPKPMFSIITWLCGFWREMTSIFPWQRA